MPEFYDGFLSSGQYIFFRGRWTDSVNNTLFKVVFSQKIPYIYPVEVGAGEYVDVDFKDNGLFPESEETAYEIGIGMKGDALIYPMIPVNKYYNALEKSGYVPNLETGDKKYVGPFDENVLGMSFRLKEYTLADYNDIAYRVYGDSYRATKAVLYFLVNRLHIVQPDTEETERIISNLSDYVAKGVVRIVNSYTEARW